eukprot:29468-Pelagococcus_subviridis.AAC.6
MECADFWSRSNILPMTSMDTELYCAANWNRYVRIASSLRRLTTFSSTGAASPGRSFHASNPRMISFACDHRPSSRNLTAAMTLSRTFSGGPLNVCRS